MYDVIVVGARCAGAPPAMLLAQRGYRCCWWTAPPFPQRHLVDSLHQAARRGHAPAVGAARPGHRLRLPAGGTVPVRLQPRRPGRLAPPLDGAGECYAPRRTILDAILSDLGPARVTLPA